jgi:hypothetical protein
VLYNIPLHVVRDLVVMVICAIFGATAGSADGYIQEKLKREAPIIVAHVPPPFFNVFVLPSRSAAPSNKEKPDIHMYLSNPTVFAVVLENLSGAIMQHPAYAVIVWDLDLPQRTDALPIPVFSDASAFIRPRGAIGPFAAMLLPAVQALVKKGDRIAGWIWVTCPDCIREREYWVFAVHGENGWFSEIADARNFVATNAFVKALPTIRANPEHFFSEIPPKARTPFVELP